MLDLLRSQTRWVSTDRYEPVPDITRLPGWLWQRMGRGVRIAVLLLVLALIAAGAALLPGIQESKDEQARSEAGRRAAARAELARRLEREQRPRFERSAAVAPAGAGAQQQLAARAELMEELPAAVLADARARVRSGALDGPVLRVACEPFPRSVDATGADEDLSRRSGRYSCIAVTAEFERSEPIDRRRRRPPVPGARRLRERPLRLLQGLRPGRPLPRPARDHAARLRGLSPPMLRAGEEEAA